MKLPSIITATLLLSLYASCAHRTPPKRTAISKSLPPKFSLYSEAPTDSTNRWWDHFASTELNRLIEEALTNSPSIQQAWARLEQAEAVATQQNAARLPALTYEAGARADRNSLTETTTETFSLGLKAAYELDLWGRVRSQSEAAALDLEASREQLHTAATSLASGVALNWISMLSQQKQTELIGQQLEANQTALELIELRFRKGLSNALEIYQQRQVVADGSARIPVSELRETQFRHALAALLGRTDLPSLSLHTSDLPQLPPLPALGLPADLLANRPDVRRAGLQLQAADWRISAARAERLPSLRLSAGASYENGELARLFDDWFANLAANLTGPIFEGGRRKAEVQRARAVAKERLHAYREIVINAMREVENALAAEQQQQNVLDQLNQRLKLGQDTYDEAVNRYRNGLSEYLNVLSALRNVQDLEREQVAAQAEQLRNRIALYRALGGSWPNQLRPL